MAGCYREKLLSSFFDNVTFDQVCRVVDEHVGSHDPGYMMSLNLDIMIRADKDPVFADALVGADLILMDSAPLIKVASKRGIECVEKLSGSDLMPRICEHAARRGYTCAIVGGMPGVPEKAAEELAAQFPGLVFKKAISPEFGFEKNSESLNAVIGQIADLGADILFLCLGEPKSGLLVREHLGDMGVSFVFNVGAAVDFAAGNVNRAPKWMQDHGFEWLYRFLKEPKRLFKRYFIDSWHFVAICQRDRRKAGHE